MFVNYFKSIQNVPFFLYFYFIRLCLKIIAIKAIENGIGERMTKNWIHPIVLIASTPSFYISEKKKETIKKSNKIFI